MLRITIPSQKAWDSIKEEFIETKEYKLQLEHSLVSISKWESKWHKPFLSTEEKSIEEVIDYIRCMTLTQNIDPKAYMFLTAENIEQINEYIEDPMSATTFSDGNRQLSKEIITSEIIYYWMITFNIPLECQKWHISRLMTLIKVCSIKNSPQKRMSANEILNRNRELNEYRKKKLNTKG